MISCITMYLIIHWTLNNFSEPPTYEHCLAEMFCKAYCHILFWKFCRKFQLRIFFPQFISFYLSGLTRSRPDILADSFVSAFNSPANIPKESIGSFLEAKLAEGEVVREFEKIPKKKTSNCNTAVATLAENMPRNRLVFLEYKFLIIGK